MTGRQAKSFVDRVASLRFDDTFNPYSDRYEPYDLEGAPAMRRRNLELIVEVAARTGVAELWIGLELGHNGGRRTGLAMTDDDHLEAHGQRFGVDSALICPTRAGPTSEMTAGIVWEALASISESVFLWNVVPVHPHRCGEPLSNRRHTSNERDACTPILKELMSLIRPKRLVAIGGDAAKALGRLGYPYTAVRHPAFGGKRPFLEQIAALDRT